MRTGAGHLLWLLRGDADITFFLSQSSPRGVSCELRATGELPRARGSGGLGRVNHQARVASTAVPAGHLPSPEGLGSPAASSLHPSHMTPAEGVSRVPSTQDNVPARERMSSFQTVQTGGRRRLSVTPRLLLTRRQGFLCPLRPQHTKETQRPWAGVKATWAATRRGFWGTVPQHVVCMLCCVFATSGYVSFLHYFSPYPLLPPRLPISSGKHHTAVCVSEVFCFCGCFIFC